MPEDEHLKHRTDKSINSETLRFKLRHWIDIENYSVKNKKIRPLSRADFYHSKVGVPQET